MSRRAVFFIFILAVIVAVGFFILRANKVKAEGFVFDNLSNSGSLELPWTSLNCSLQSYQSGFYIKMLKSDSILFSNNQILSGYDNYILTFEAKTYGTTTGEFKKILVQVIVIDHELSTTTITTVLEAKPEKDQFELFSVDLTSFKDSDIKLKFQTPNAQSNKGVGIYKIKTIGFSDNVIANQLPIANAGVDKDAEVDELVDFDGMSSSDPDGLVTSWYWDFGTFQLLGATTSHAFSATGTYQVALTVTDDQGATSSPDYAVVNVRERGSATSTATTTASTTVFSVGDILINELLPAPTSGNKEWIELYNDTDSPIDLSGWTLLNKEGSKFSTTTLFGIIDPDDFLIVEGIVGSLNNSGDEVVLKDLAGQIISQTSYGDFSSCYDCAWARGDAGSYLLTITPTKNAINIITPKVSAPPGGFSNVIDKEAISATTESNQATTTPKTEDVAKVALLVIINEVYPNPDSGQEEFIEFRNLDTKSADLSGLVIADASKKKFKIASSTVLEAGGYAVFLRSQSNIALNNSGLETISLSYADGSIIDKVSYSGSKKGKSFSRKDSGEWQWSDMPTPAQENIFSLPAEELPTAKLSVATSKTTVKKVTTKTTKSSSVVVSSPLDQVRNLENGSRVKVSGVVSVAPGVLGAQIFYIAGSGIQIYSYNKTFPDLKIGDQIEVAGELSESGGERRIKISSIEDIKILGSGEAPVPHQISTADVGEEYEGSLVMIEGDLLEKKSRNFFIDDGSGAEAKGYIRNHIAIEELGIKEGEKIRLTGIVSQTSSGYRVLPRFPQDIEVIKGEVKGDFEVSYRSFGKEYYLAALIIFLAAVIIWLIYKWPDKKTPK